MATRVIVEKPPEAKPAETIGRVHRRSVVATTSTGAERMASIRETFDERLKKNINVLRDPRNPWAADVFADLFVNDVREVHGWYRQVIAIADSLEQNGDETLRMLGYYIRHHAEQIWAARHVDDSKRSG